MALLTLVRPSFYQDSVALLALARELRARPDVAEAAALMGTPANRELLAQAGLLTAEAAAAGPNDLVVVIDAAPAAASPARARAEELLSARRARREHGGRHAPRTIDGALRRMPDADLALISVPGAWAAAEARRALARGLHVMIWSDNVSIEDEVALKQLAARQWAARDGPGLRHRLSRRHPARLCQSRPARARRDGGGLGHGIAAGGDAPRGAGRGHLAGHRRGRSRHEPGRRRAHDARRARRPRRRCRHRGHRRDRQARRTRRAARGRDEAPRHRQARRRRPPRRGHPDRHRARHHHGGDPRRRLPRRHRGLALVAARVLALARRGAAARRGGAPRHRRGRPSAGSMRAGRSPTRPR